MTTNLTFVRHGKARNGTLFQWWWSCNSIPQRRKNKWFRYAINQPSTSTTTT